MILGDVVAINDVLNNAEFKNLQINTFSALIDFKLEASKLNQKKDEFIKESYEKLKPENFDSLDKESEEFKKLNQELMLKLNDVMITYLSKESEIKVTKIDKLDFYVFCNNNNFSGRTIEFLYNLFV